MASIKFNRSNNLIDEKFYFQFRIEVVKLVAHLDEIFSDFFEGVFEITVDEEEPQAGYTKELGEEFDEDLLSANIEVLNKRMVQIAQKITKLNEPWF